MNSKKVLQLSAKQYYSITVQKWIFSSHLVDTFLYFLDLRRVGK